MSDEREFLHSMANHLAVAWASIESVLADGEGPELRTAMDALEKMKECLDARRAAHRSRG
jgi:hypothetical protein